MANIPRPGDENFTIKLNQALSSPPVGIIELFSAVNIGLSITAVLGNALILIALHNVSTIYPPTKLFLRCLAVTDLGVGLLAQPLYVTIIMSALIKINDHDVFYVLQVGLTLCWCLGHVPPILTLAAISVDRPLALFLGLRYRHVVTLRRVTVVIIWFWLTGALASWIRMQRINLAHKQVSVILTLSLITI